MPGKIKVVYLFLGAHRRWWAAAVISLCLKMKFISERGWEGERCEETERMKKTEEWERETAALLSAALALFWCYWACDKCELLPIRPCQSQEMPLSQTANTRGNDISQTENLLSLTLSLSFFFPVWSYCYFICLLVISCLFVVFNWLSLLYFLFIMFIHHCLFS